MFFLNLIEIDLPKNAKPTVTPNLLSEEANPEKAVKGLLRLAVRSTTL